jgi:hypothetical protein
MGQTTMEVSAFERRMDSIIRYSISSARLYNIGVPSKARAGEDSSSPRNAMTTLKR